MRLNRKKKPRALQNPSVDGGDFPFINISAYQISTYDYLFKCICFASGFPLFSPLRTHSNQQHQHTFSLWNMNI